MKEFDERPGAVGRSGTMGAMKQRRKATGPIKWVDTARGRFGVAEYPSGEIRLYIEYDSYLAIAEAHLGPAGVSPEGNRTSCYGLTRMRSCRRAGRCLGQLTVLRR
jgi:hypothetical protein